MPFGVPCPQEDALATLETVGLCPRQEGTGTLTEPPVVTQLTGPRPPHRGNTAYVAVWERMANWALGGEGRAYWKMRFHLWGAVFFKPAHGATCPLFLDQGEICGSQQNCPSVWCGSRARFLSTASGKRHPCLSGARVCQFRVFEGKNPKGRGGGPPPQPPSPDSDQVLARP